MRRSLTRYWAAQRRRGRRCGCRDGENGYERTVLIRGWLYTVRVTCPHRTPRREDA